MDFFNRITERFIIANRKLRKLHKVVSVLAAIIVFATTYALILPAITLDQDTASAQSGIEVAASDHETDSGGGVYEEEPEEESDEDGSGGQQDEEILSEDSDSQGEDISDDDDPGRDTEPEQGQNTDEQTEIEEFPDDDNGGSDETDPDGSDSDETRSDETLEDDPNAETPADGEILTDGESLEEIKLITEKTLLTYEYTDKYYEDGIDDENDDGIDGGYFVYAEIEADAKLPEGVELSAEEITKEGDPEAYEVYYEKALSGLQDKYDKDDENAVLSFARFYDIRFVYNGEEVEPAAEVKVRIEYKKALEIEKATNIDTVHFDKNNGEEPEIIKSEVNSPESLGPDGSGSEIGSSKGTMAKAGRLKAAKSGAVRSEADTDNGGNEIVKTVDFESDRFSVYGIVGTVIVKTVLASDGNNYNVTVTCGPEAGIPADAELAVEEITEGSSANGMSYEDYVAYTENALGIEEGGSGYIRLFDISIVMDGEKIQPADGSSVGVRIELADSSSDRLNVVHFPDGSKEGEEVESSTENGENGSVVEFRADGFSVYSIVDAPKPVPVRPTGWYLASSLDEIEAFGSDGFYLSHSKYYFTGELIHGVTENNDRDGLVGTATTYDSVPEDVAGKFYFERQEGTNTFKIYTKGEGDARNYVKATKVSARPARGGLTFVTEESEATAFTVAKNGSNNNFYISAKVDNTEYWWNRNNKDPGLGAFVGYNNRGDQNTAKVELCYYVEEQNDPYELNGKSFGIAYHDDSTSAAALTAESSADHLGALDMLMRADVLSNKGILLVAKNSDIQEWTFVSADLNNYYIKTTVDGEEKYLKIDGANVSLVDQADASQIKAEPGTGANKGKWHFTVNGYSLNFSGSASNGFNAAYNSNASTWMNLVERSPLSEDDFVEYSARKISASDDLLSATEKDDNGAIKRDEEGNPVYREKNARVVVYTRVWNHDTSKYEYYAVDHDGSLVRVYDSGDLINWVGNKVNSALWEFTEYTNEDGTPSNYYELKNTAYSDTYLAPQSSGIIANQPVGINLEGRQEGLDYTSIVAWDAPAYAYSGLKVEGGKVVTCPKDEADDFYFAVIVPQVLEADDPTTVETVDNNDFGISMRMIDFNNKIIRVENNGTRDEVQHAFFGGHAYTQNDADTGLLSTNLINGYPTTTAKTGNAGRSLSELYKKEDLTDANNLFIQSVYNESGYFEYDSAQNFAHYNTEGEYAGDFTVYNQIAAIGTNTGVTRTHGQFMPYNSISKEVGYAYDTGGNLITNKTDVLRRELPDSDPRKGEPLYSIPDADADYFFGMELSASFTQTPNGLDNWGHDIIFEFTGDDDFWLYVDDELVLDLGGIHSAMPGSVNFRTGEVVVNRTTTTLYDIFRSNYEARGMSAATINSKLASIFETKEIVDKNGRTKTVHVFKEYTKHTMKMFYMERGAGASNLKMRFNLASVQPGTVELAKKLKGTNSASNKLIQYPYQIWYREPVYEMDGNTIVHNADGNPVIAGYGDPIRMVQGATSSSTVGVFFKGSKKKVPYKSSLKIGDTVYQDVFLLKAGQTGVIKFPNRDCIYEIIECGVDTEVYDQVSVNGEAITGTLYNNTDTGAASGTDERRQDFGIDYETTGNRPRAEYSNQVDPDAMRTLSFEKLVYDSEGNPISDEQLANISSKFNFRLYLGDEFSDENDLALANMYSYYVKAPGGSYCRWNQANQQFDPLGITQFEGSGGLEEYLSTASSAERSAIVFTTSLNGAIAHIPAGYTVEVRDLIVGTKYKVDEPDREIPKGYTRRDSDGYVRTDLDEDYVYYTDEEGTYGRHPEDGNRKTAEPISDTIANKNESPKIEIRNQEGWGLTAGKEWTDKDFMIHDPIYMAVYLDDGTGKPGQLIDGTVRRLNTGETEIYWFFPDLKIGEETYSFGEFIVREVELTVEPPDELVVDKNGVVTGYTDIEPVDDGGPISVSGKTISGTPRTEDYTVNYDPGDPTGQNHNIRTDTVTNSRPGIQIYKTDWSGETYLAGAEFTLKDSNGHDVGHEVYTSNSSGLVTTAYLNEGTFTLKEIKTPFGYVAPDEPITITVTTTEPIRYDLTVTVGSTIYYIALSGPVGFYTADEATSDTMARITVKNRTVQELKVVKVGVDGDTRTLLSGVHFALYEQVKDSEGNVRPAYNPMDGYDDLVTNDEGILAGITMSIGAGTYYLREKAAPSGYKLMPEDLCFTIGGDGTVKINNAGYAGWLTKDTSVPGTVSYQISVENTPLGITIRKTDEAGQALPGSRFKLCIKNDAGIFVAVTGIAGIGDEGLIDLTGTSEMTFSGLGNGIYKLTEDHAPEGHIILTKDIYFSVSNGAMTLTDDSGAAKEYSGVSLLDNNTTIAVVNPGGAELPHTGGPGTWMFTFSGIVLLVLAAVGLLLRRRRIV